MDWQYQVAATFIGIVVLWVVLQYISEPPQRRSAAVVVLGDIGRSPRIMYHAQSFALNDFETYVVGYKGETTISIYGLNLTPISGAREVSSLLTLSRVRFVYLPVPPAFIAKMPRQFFLILAPLKVIFQLVTITSALFYQIERPPEFILVQVSPLVTCWNHLPDCGALARTRQVFLPLHLCGSQANSEVQKSLSTGTTSVTLSLP